MSEVRKIGEGLRYNDGKVRHDLLEPYAIHELAKVFTLGAQKYAPNNWLKGMEWSKITASLKRHLNAYEKGEDYDPETGLLHAAHIAWNAMALVSYYKHFPQGDDRIHTFIKKPRIALDIDEVLADWVGLWCQYFKEDLPEFWNFDRDIGAKFEMLKDNKDFWLSIKPKINPSDIPFEPVAYVTSRSIPTEWTEEWLRINKFPSVPVYTVGFGVSKIETLKQLNVDIFVDDRYENFEELNRAGICCYLMDALHNKRYDVGFKRIFSLKDLIIK